MIQDIGHDIYSFLDYLWKYLSFVKSSCILTLSSFSISLFELKLKLKAKLTSFFIHSVIAFLLGWFLYFLRAISTSLKLFSVKVALSFSVIPKF